MPWRSQPLKRLARLFVSAVPAVVLALPALASGAPATAVAKVVPAPVPVAPPPPPVLVPSREFKDNEIAALQLVEASEKVEDPAEAEAMLRRALALVPTPGEIRGGVACSLAARIHLDSGESPADVRKTIAAADECYRLMPDLPAAQMLVGGVRIAAGQGRAGGGLLLAAIRAEPALLSGFDLDAMKRLLRQLGYAGAFDLLGQIRTVLVEAGYGKDDPTFYSTMAVEQMLAQIAANSLSEAVALLPQVTDPELGLQLVLDRRFEPIWPMIEQWSAGTLQPQRDAALKLARSRFANAGDLPNRRLLGDALWDSGQHAEAIALFAEAVNDPKLWDKDRYHIVLMTVRYAKMLVFAGRADEAIAAASRVDAANPAQSYPYAANLMPNLARLLIQLGREQAALDLIARQMPTELEDRAAFGFYTALRYCAYRRLGRMDEAKRQSALFDRAFANNGAAAGIRAACSTDPASARDYWVARLLDPGSRGSALVKLERARLGIKTIHSIDQFGADDLAAAIPSLRAGIGGFARDLPPSYLPALRMWAPEAAPARTAPVARAP